MVELKYLFQFWRLNGISRQAEADAASKQLPLIEYFNYNDAIPNLIDDKAPHIVRSTGKGNKR